MQQKIMLLLNPISGKKTAKNLIIPLVNYFMKFDDEVHIYTTLYKNHAEKLVNMYAPKNDLLICIGGDGTLNETMNGLMTIKKRPILCYIPTGTVNDFANTLSLSKNIESIYHLLLRKQVFTIDIGKFNEKYFSYIAAFGAFTEVSYQTPQQTKSLFGKAAYFLEGMKQLPKITSYHSQIIYDDGLIEEELIFGGITNSNFVGGFKSFHLKNTELDDGLFEVLLIKPPKNPLDFQLILSSLITQKPNDKFMYFFKTKTLKIQHEQEVIWTLDGEKGGKYQNITIENIHKAIDILI